MAAGLPIVPSDHSQRRLVAARDSTTINPGTVDVVVLPPIPVDGWNLDNLDEKIAEVREIYMATLANWPKN